MGPAPVGPSPDFVDRLIGLGAEAPTLAGFDFSIGLPAAYGAKPGFSGFAEALPAFQTAKWARFFDVATAKKEIGETRPFYPMRPGKTALAHLTPAGCMFWTMGAKQVGKAA